MLEVMRVSLYSMGVYMSGDGSSSNSLSGSGVSKSSKAGEVKKD